MLLKMHKITQNSLLKKHGIFCLTFYTTVYITSNLPLEKQYRGEQWDRPETWRAFLRRIHNIIEFLPDGTTVQKKKGGWPCDQKR